MKNTNRSAQIQILFVTALSGELLAEMTSCSIGTPGKSNVDAAIAGLRDLDAMSKSQEYTSKQRRAKLAEVNAQIAQAIAFATAPGSTLRAFSEHNYTAVFTTVEKFVAYARKNGISLIERNPLALVVRDLNNVLASAIDGAEQTTWYEVILQTVHHLFSDIVTSVANRQLRPAASAFYYVGFEPMKQIAGETDSSMSPVNVPVATSGETIDDQAGEGWKQGLSPATQFGGK